VHGVVLASVKAKGKSHRNQSTTSPKRILVLPRCCPAPTIALFAMLHKST